MEFCNNSRCPAELANTGPQFSLDCCVWHANVHVCHPGDCGTPVSIQTDGWINRHTYTQTDINYSDYIIIIIPIDSYMWTMG